MLITFCPVRRDDTLRLERRGDSLVINGERFDFAGLDEGAELAFDDLGSEWFAGPVRRVAGRLELTLVLPHGPEAPQALRFPEPLEITGDGPVTVPGQE